MTALEIAANIATILLLVDVVIRWLWELHERRKRLRDEEKRPRE